MNAAFDIARPRAASRASCVVTVCIVMTLGACASAPRAAPPAGDIPVPGTPEAQRTPELPAIPLVDGPLELEVGYPPEEATIASDSNFIFGSTGSGRTQLTINGHAVDVAPNGGFLAFIPVPDDGMYRLNATKNGEMATLERRVTTPRAGAGAAVIGGAYPGGPIAVQPGETIEIGFSAPPGVRAAVLLPDGRRIPMVEQEATGEAAPGDEFRADLTTAQRQAARVRYSTLVPVTGPIITADTSVARPLIGSMQSVAPRRADTAVVRQPPLAGRGRDRSDAPLAGGPRVAAVQDGVILEIIAGADTIHEPLRLNVAVLAPDVPRVGIVTAPAGAPSDWTVRGRVDVAGPFHFFWPEGTRLTVTGQRGGMYRVRLTDDRVAWVPTGDVRIVAEGAPPPGGAVAAVRFAPEPQHVDLRIPVPARLPYQVTQQGKTTLHIDIFGAVSRINFFQYGRLDPLVEGAAWSQPAADVLRVSVDLAEPVWGYHTFFDPAGALILRIRRPPNIDPAAPLRGLFIGVDPGHGGEDRSTRGPTDMREADANLQISLQLRELLEQAGTRVMMTRTTDMTVPLGDRPRMAADSGVHVLLSVHNNAFPDGVNPWTNNGTSTYYYHPHALELARLLQRELLEELGLRDIGFGRADLALARPTWMPAVLTETAFMMIPEQEAALRDPAVQRRIAAAHVRALEAFLRSRARN